MTSSDFPIVIIFSIIGIAFLIAIIFGLTRWIFKIDQMEALQKKQVSQLDEIILLLENNKI